jgi:hypothetical protein
MRWRRRLLRRQRKNGNSPKQTADRKPAPFALALERVTAYRRMRIKQETARRMTKPFAGGHSRPRTHYVGSPPK